MKFLNTICAARQTNTVPGSDGTDGPGRYIMAGELITKDRLAALEGLQQDSQDSAGGRDMNMDVDSSVGDSLYMVNTLYIRLIKSIAVGCRISLV